VTEKATAVIGESCESCGADVRSESLFCYNCGDSLERSETSVTDSATQELGTVRQEPNGSSNKVVAIKEGPGLPSAASIRKRSEAYRRKPAQIVWEPAEPEWSMVLILATLGLLLFAIIMVALALYVK
jgi:hypothetical protein